MSLRRYFRFKISWAWSMISVACPSNPPDGVETVLGNYLMDQMLPCDLDLLILGVAGDADDLQAIHERRRNVERVCRRHEHHVGEIVVDLEIVVVEGMILLGVEHLEQGRGRITAEIGPHRRSACLAPLA